MTNRTSSISVSAVIPAYNSQVSISKCLESVINQTVPVLEIIVVNDGSTDDTVAIINQFIDDHPKFIIKLFTVPNGGPSAARNLGIEKATGDLIAFLDADDCWVNNKLEEQLEVFYTYGTDVIIVGCKTSDVKFKSVEDKWIVIDFNMLLWSNVFSTPAVVTWRHLLLNTRFNVRQKYSEDYGLWLQLAKGGKSVIVNKKLVLLSDKPIYGHSGLSSQLWKMTKGEFMNFKLLRQKNYISISQYYFFCALSLLKHFRRVLITRFN